MQQSRWSIPGTFSAYRSLRTTYLRRFCSQTNSLSFFQRGGTVSSVANLEYCVFCPTTLRIHFAVWISELVQRLGTNLNAVPGPSG